MIVHTEAINLPLPAPRHARTPGIHLSGIIRAIAMESGILTPEQLDDFSLADVREVHDPTARLRMNIGLAWEEFYVREHLPDVVAQPGELEVAGIYMTPDGEALDMVLTGDVWRHQPRGHEVKATYKSTKTVGIAPPHELLTQWMWLAQMKGYAKALDTRFMMLHVLFLCGDYSYPIRPRLYRYEVEFTSEEIEMNWTLMTDYRDHRARLEAGDE